jgi:hypothetical protein
MPHAMAKRMQEGMQRTIHVRTPKSDSAANTKPAIQMADSAVRHGTLYFSTMLKAKNALVPAGGGG